MTDDLPDFIPEGTPVIGDDALPCDRCGEQTPFGKHRDERWLCNECDLREDDKTDVVIGGSALCECGTETHFRRPTDAEPEPFAFSAADPLDIDDGDDGDDDDDVNTVISGHLRQAGLWICPRCLEMFVADECDDCGRQALTNAVFGESGEYCNDCIRGNGG